MPTMIGGLLATRSLGRGLLAAQSDLTEDEWAIVGPILPSERGRNCRPALDNRQFLNGMLWVACTRAPWRELPPEYGKWNSVYQRFRRWSQIGVCDAVVKSLARSAVAQGKRNVTDRTSVQARIRAAALQGMIRDRRSMLEPPPLAAPRSASGSRKGRSNPGRPRSTTRRGTAH